MEEKYNNSKIPKMQNDKDRSVIVSSICVDFGLGFLEENTRLAKCELVNGNYRFKFFLNYSRKIKAICWKVYEPYGCKCRVNWCKLDKDYVKIIALNAENRDSTLFLSANPQYKVKVSSDFYHVFEIEGELKCLEPKEYFYEICRYKQYINIILAENEGLYSDYKDSFHIKKENDNMKKRQNLKLISRLRKINRHSLALKTVCIWWKIVVKLRKCKVKNKDRCR